MRLILIPKMKNITKEQFLTILIVLFAAGVRFGFLGRAPLSDFEADWAMQALSVSKSTSAPIGPQPLYVLLTGFIFFVFGSSNFLARIIPAIAGTLLVLAPLLLQDKFGRKAALILAAGLAIDPGLIAASRLAGSPIMALCFTLMAIIMIIRVSPWIGGILAGLALLSGPSVFIGILSLGLTLLLIHWNPLSKGKNAFHLDILFSAKKDSYRKIGVGMLGTILLVGTGLFLFPQGIGAFADQIPAYFRGWGITAGVPVGRLLVSLFTYQPLALILGSIGVVTAWIKSEPQCKGLSLLIGSTLIMVFLYPSHQVLDLIWVIVPLWTLAAIWLARNFRVSDIEPISLGIGTILIVLSVLVWMQLSGLQFNLGETQAVQWRWILMGIISALGILIIIIIGLGWSWDVAINGAFVGIGSSLIIYGIAVAFGVSFIRSGSPTELWNPVPTTGQADLLNSTLGELSLIQTGRKDSIEIVSIVDVPSLRWVLRDFINVRYQRSISNSDTFPIVITSEKDEGLINTNMYRGQDFSWWEFPDWHGSLPPNWVSWLTFREAPIHKEHLIVWGRGDLFFDQSVGIPQDELEGIDLDTQK